MTMDHFYMNDGRWSRQLSAMFKFIWNNPLLMEIYNWIFEKSSLSFIMRRNFLINLSWLVDSLFLLHSVEVNFSNWGCRLRNRWFVVFTVPLHMILKRALTPLYNTNISSHFPISVPVPFQQKTKSLKI